MLPIRDTIQSKSYPVVNTILIAANVLFYLIEMAQGDRLEQFIIIYGLVPARYSVPEIAVHFSLGQQIFSFVSFMFIHGGFWHLLGNMWTLYIFGDNGKKNSVRSDTLYSTSYAVLLQDFPILLLTCIHRFPL